MRLIARPLSAAAFAPFGRVSDAPGPDDRVRIGPAVNRRAHAATRLDWVLAEAKSLPLTTQVMERHRHSSQSFVPCDAGARWLVLVAPYGADGRPDLAAALAFVADGNQALTYAPDVWHHPLCALDRPARFALLTHLDDGPDDDEFFTLPVKLEIVAEG
jgi:ureidoglycolate lyase